MGRKAFVTGLLAAAVNALPQVAAPGGGYVSSNPCVTTTTKTLPANTYILTSPITYSGMPLGNGMTMPTPGPVYVTVYTTVYKNFCPTGLADVTYTITETCSGEPMPSPTNYVPQGFVVTIATCQVCGEQPLTATLTLPCEECAPATNTYTTVYTTAYPYVCPTGLAESTYTITESCTGTAPNFPMTTESNYMPPGFQATTTVCDVCAATPTTLTLTAPCNGGCEAATGAAGQQGSQGGYSQSPASGGQSPASGGQSPASGGQSPAMQMGQSPAYQGQSPAGGLGGQGYSSGAAAGSNSNGTYSGATQAGYSNGAAAPSSSSYSSAAAGLVSAPSRTTIAMLLVGGVTWGFAIFL